MRFNSIQHSLTESMWLYLKIFLPTFQRDWVTELSTDFLQKDHQQPWHNVRWSWCLPPGSEHSSQSTYVFRTGCNHSPSFVPESWQSAWNLSNFLNNGSGRVFCYWSRALKSLGISWARKASFVLLSLGGTLDSFKVKLFIKKIRS